ncbi:hypothetical protein BKI52_02885 [marine bacterium AO1-C]|nr:hypothetical protein BKI52_02885 [marine bacterium AO1-C]
MNKIKLLLLLFFGIYLNGFGQACGVYKIVYKGYIKSDVAIQEVKFPSRDFLEQDGSKSLKQKQWVTNFQKALSGKFNDIIYYPTCSAGASVKTRINWIKKGKTFLPLLVITTDGKRIWIRVPIDQIEFNEAKKNKNNIEINFKEIKI